MDQVELSKLQNLDGTGKIPPLAPEQLPQFRAEVENFAAELALDGIIFTAFPFVLPEEIDPPGLAEQITSFFYQLRDIDGPILSLLWQRLTGFTATRPELKPIVLAGERIAADYDRGLGAGTRNAFHNRQHTVETLVIAHVLALLDDRQDQNLSPQSRLELLLAALIHDWHHDGGINGNDPCRLEKIAMHAARPYLDDVPMAERTRLDLIIRTTDPFGPAQYARTALAYQRLCSRLSITDKRPPEPKPPAGLEVLSALMEREHATTVEIAALLRDADALLWAGLTADYAALCSSRLRDERAAPFAQAEYGALVSAMLARPRTNYDERPKLDEEPEGMYFAFASRPGQFFNANILDVVRNHARLMEEMGEAPQPEEQQPEEETGVDLSMFEQAQQEAQDLGVSAGVTPEAIKQLRHTLKNAGFFENPPFTLKLKMAPRDMRGMSAELINRIAISEQTADSLQRLHAVSGPIISALMEQIFEHIGLAPTDPVHQAAMAIAGDLDNGHGTGTANDDPAGERNPYHNQHHIIDMILLADMLGQRATLRGAPASSPLARGLFLLGALICHWHHTGKGNRVDGQYRHFYLQDRALSFSTAHTAAMSKEMRASLEILVRSTDPREPYAFTRLAYGFHVGINPRPEIPPGCEPLARLLTDPALCTLCARLNDVVFIPYVGLGANYSAMSIVRMGREIGQPIDFNFVRKNLIGPMLSRQPYPGEKPSPLLIVGNNRVASFTTSEAQALFNAAMQALLVSHGKRNAPAAPVSSVTGKPIPAAAPEALQIADAPHISIPEPTNSPAETTTPAPPPGDAAAAETAAVEIEVEVEIEVPAPETPAAESEPEHIEPDETDASPTEPVTDALIADTPEAAPEPQTIEPEAQEAIPEAVAEAVSIPDEAEAAPELNESEPEETEPEAKQPVPPTAAPITAPAPTPPATPAPAPQELTRREPAPREPAAHEPASREPDWAPDDTVIMGIDLESLWEMDAPAPAQPTATAAPVTTPEDEITASDLISALLEEGLTTPQATSSFPYFRYHPDPISSGVIKPSPLKCVCCGQVRGFSYYGPIHEATLGEHRICPWCIADGSAHERLGAVFSDPQPLIAAGLSAEIIKEVTRRTPGYQSWQPDSWLVHCKDACAYAGDATIEEVGNAPTPLRKAMLEYYDMGEKSWPLMVERYAPGGDPGVYKFSCRHCGEVLFSWDCT